MFAKLLRKFGKNAKNSKMNLYREIIAALEWGDSPVIVVGHKTPDADSVMSAIAYANLMRKLGYCVEARVAGKINNETKLVAEKFGIELPKIFDDNDAQRFSDDVSDADVPRLILVDHNLYSQAVDCARKARILQLIDHHGLGDIVESHLLYAKEMPVGSTCTIVYMSYLELDVEIDLHMTKVLLAGLVADTKNLKKVTTTDVDRHVHAALVARLAEFEGCSVEAETACIVKLYEEMTAAAHDFSGMSDVDVFESDAKTFEIGGLTIRLGSLDWNDATTVDAFLDRILNAMKEISGYQVVMCGVGCGNDYYMLYMDGKNAPGKINLTAQNIAESTFGKSIRRGIIQCPRRLSRKLDVVPMLKSTITEC